MTRLTVCDYHPRRTSRGKYGLIPFRRYDEHGEPVEFHFCDECVADFLAGRRNPIPKFEEWEPFGSLFLGHFVGYFEYHEPACDLSCGRSPAEHDERGWTYVLPGVAV